MNKVCQNDASHASNDPDVCSQCGGEMIDPANAAPVAVAPSAAPAASGGDPLTCACGFPKRHKAQKVCENCGLIFLGPDAGKYINPDAGADEQDNQSGAGEIHSSPVVPPAVPVNPGASAGSASNGAGSGSPADVVNTTLPSANSVSLPADAPRLRLRIVLATDDRPRTPTTLKPSAHHEGIYLLDRSPITIGRTSGHVVADISLGEDDGVSRRHGEFLFEAGAWHYRDVGSSNGSVIVSTGSDGSEERSKPAVNALTEIKVGDRICIGFWTDAVVESR